MTTVQQAVNRYIEIKMSELAKRGNLEGFQKTLQKNIAMKRESASSTIDFYDRLMLNITYFVENKESWAQLYRKTFGTGRIPKVSLLETEALADQMRIRQLIAEKMELYTSEFHKQYAQLDIADEDVIYDYAYASVCHSLRYDFLTYLALQQDAAVVLNGDLEETIRIIEGYVEYFADQQVNKIQLN